MSLSSKLIPETEVDPELDVILVQGSVAEKYSGGTKKYRDLVTEKELAYTETEKGKKMRVSKSIVKTITSAGGRYLERIEIGGKTYYKAIGKKDAIKKTSDALRKARKKRVKKTAQGAASLLALANAAPQPAATTTNAPPSQAPVDTGPDIIRVFDFVDLTWSDQSGIDVLYCNGVLY